MCKACFETISDIKNSPRYQMMLRNLPKALEFIKSIDIGDGGYTDTTPEEDQIVAAIGVLAFAAGYSAQEGGILQVLPETFFKSISTGSLTVGADEYEKSIGGQH